VAWTFGIAGAPLDVPTLGWTVQQQLDVGCEADQLVVVGCAHSWGGEFQPSEQLQCIITWLMQLSSDMLCQRE
jgi:hypothetical protein